MGLAEEDLGASAFLGAAAAVVEVEAADLASDLGASALGASPFLPSVAAGLAAPSGFLPSVSITKKGLPT